MCAVSMLEKSPLLPLNSEEECPRIECYKNKEYKRKYKRQGLFFVFFVIIFFIQNGYQDRLYDGLKNGYQRRSNHHDVNVNSYLLIENTANLNDIVSYNQNQMNAFAEPFLSARQYTCNTDEPKIPFEGLSKFEFDSNDFSALSIKQNTSSHFRSFSIGSGESKVYQDDSVSKVTVEFDLKFNREELQDIFWIEKTEDTETHSYSLSIRSDESYNTGTDACVLISVTVRVPKSDSLDQFSLGLSNNQVEYQNDLTFNKLSTSISNGSINFSKLATGKTNFAIANGHVTGDIKSLNDGLRVSIANGHSNIQVKKITSPTEDHAIPITVEVANGHVDLQVPSDFESNFSLNSFVGRRIVESSKPEDIHRKGSSWGVTSGYFGNNSATKNNIKLSASSGNLHLNYA